MQVVEICSFSASANPYFLYSPEREQRRRHEQEAGQDQPYPPLAAEHLPASLAASRSKHCADRCRLLLAAGTHRPMGRMAALPVAGLGMAQYRIEPLGRRRHRRELLTSPPQKRCRQDQLAGARRGPTWACQIRARTGSPRRSLTGTEAPVSVKAARYYRPVPVLLLR
jgi:hypothetical protein